MEIRKATIMFNNSVLLMDKFNLFAQFSQITEAPEFGLAKSEPKYCFRRGQKNFLPPLFITFLDVSDLPEPEKRKKKIRSFCLCGWMDGDTITLERKLGSTSGFHFSSSVFSKE